MSSPSPKLTIPLRSVLSNEFVVAIQTLMRQPLSMAASFNLALCVKEIDAQRTAYHDAMNKRVRELGEPAVGEPGGEERWEVRDEEKKKLLVAELNALIEATTITLPIRKKLDASGAVIAGAHVIYLLDLLADPNPEETPA